MGLFYIQRIHNPGIRWFFQNLREQAMKTLKSGTFHFLMEGLMRTLKDDPDLKNIRSRENVEHTLDYIIAGADEEQILHVMRRLIDRSNDLVSRKQ